MNNGKLDLIFWWWHAMHGTSDAEDEEVSISLFIFRLLH
ncbi:hypothetical protein T12_16055 [Trichinella patagoniensis]|uniref:Uncharacterized protein n=1 Tax=Trichinella patagoniensis TaxID=990121 RepID=A0A0V0XS52_9BILA|nr:hypothetical protein T12_16055 [Trichinella patagoniensis]